ncbi:hypothetical protein COT44_03475 [Candidatus Shapirobacteria bacterium CG08_land_8_20_14_0_20_39_18]|uniref:Uncharacterized protein n=1 Tax=Candidatus Shapirobacteria bacterium CG08_land_8_20_14_0_20_39_18 TaxID=1974883 RepID=A0A2M6XCU6_9BACT|nr:MAG: hypothetical protein COT44_03475 [Candidatus Shapirobacteria bacterium CG08_land_8_20_14_0_20_39_18]PIY65121.1 MAG: hypothetical protein COY91_03585 [Candidatus Shapirobacteria bacterium CG_4_10_14_0_8_um_filter_39_15]PJE68305.1 MAG: hypothetical protein COU94_02650 [Candidatus Shapirobacteria bacterium CG10_big_fil_rev_8_21_14_0_10_38_8]
MAEITNPALSTNLQALNGVEFLNKFLPAMITLLFVIASLVSFVLLVIGGVQYMTSGGDKAGTEASKEQMTHALIGLILVFSAYAVIGLVGKFFNMDLTLINIDAIMLK